ncbi:MAG TPA: STAS domain-containing protein [Polyangia bacterium]|nr:STAS domain-containing protein [Polyangia bacterium]
MTFFIAPLDSGVTRVALQGSVDIFTIGLLRPELLLVIRARPAVVEVDFSSLRSINTSGMQVLVSFCTDLSRIGTRIVIKGLQGQPLQRFRAALVEAIRHASGSAN